jgi:hypothetical protein
VRSFTLPDLVVLVRAYQHAVSQTAGRGAAGAPLPDVDSRLPGLVAGLLQARGLHTPASLGPSLQLLEILGQLQTTSLQTQPVSQTTRLLL